MFSVTFILYPLKDNHYANHAIHQDNQDQLRSFYHTILFCCTRIYETKFYTLFINKISNKQELQQITSNYSSDIGFDPPCGFSEDVFSRERVKQWFFMTLIFP